VVSSSPCLVLQLTPVICHLSPVTCHLSSSVTVTLLGHASALQDFHSLQVGKRFANVSTCVVFCMHMSYIVYCLQQYPAMWINIADKALILARHYYWLCGASVTSVIQCLSRAVDTALNWLTSAPHSSANNSIVSCSSEEVSHRCGHPLFLCCCLLLTSSPLLLAATPCRRSARGS